MAKEYYVHEVCYASLSKACKALSIHRSSVYLHAKKFGVTLQDAVDYYADKEKRYVVRGITYGTLSEACSAIPVSPRNIHSYRKRYNASHQEALDFFVSIS